MELKIVELKALPKLTLFVKFNDGVEGNVDLSDLKGKGVFKLWDIEGEFEKVYIGKETGVLTWNEDVDLDVLNIYLTIIGKTFEEYISEKELVH